MSTTEFIASLVGALAWPLVILVVALLFRSKIIQLLSTDMKRLKAGPIEVEWDRTIAEVEKDLDGLGQLSAKAIADDLGPISSFYAEQAMREPIFAIGAASRQVEDILFRYLSATIPKAELRTGLPGLVQIGISKGVLSAEVVRAFQLLLRLTNMASHSPGEVNTEQSVEYLVLCDFIAEQLAPK